MCDGHIPTQVSRIKNKNHETTKRLVKLRWNLANLTAEYQLDSPKVYISKLSATHSVNMQQVEEEDELHMNNRQGIISSTFLKQCLTHHLIIYNCD